MAIKIGHASIDERGRVNGGAEGDQTGGEVYTRTWYNANWDVVLRPKNADLAEKSARACEAACANNKIGYDQYSRNTLYRYAKLVNFDIANLTDECECDCSSLMHVCAIAAGANLTYGVNGLVTFNLVDAFVKSGDYEKLTESKYLLSGNYLKRGDILVRQSGHTAMALENGSLSGAETVGASPRPTESAAVTTMLTPLPLLKKGAKGGAVWAMQTLLTDRGFNTMGVDSDFGNNTFAAVKLFQKKNGLYADGECGAATWEKLINGG